jgi:hypothetical protein
MVKMNSPATKNSKALCKRWEASSSLDAVEAKTAPKTKSEAMLNNN